MVLHVYLPISQQDNFICNYKEENHDVETAKEQFPLRQQRLGIKYASLCQNFAFHGTHDTKHFLRLTNADPVR